MKRCPQCNRLESDETLSFCRSDGIPLVNESPWFNDEAGTVRVGSPAEETGTKMLSQANAAIPRGTGRTTVLHVQPLAPNGAMGKPKLQRKLIVVVVLLIAVLVTVSAVVVSSYWSKNRHAPIQSIA